MPSHQSRWSHLTPALLYCAVVFSFGDLIFGLDTGSFGSLQALPSWLHSFGTLTAGTYGLPTSHKSIMNSVVFLGKAGGTVTFEPLLERVGYRVLMYIICVIQIVGVIVELTATNWRVFTGGRVIAYFSVGLVENAVPSYLSELAPAPLRGFLSSSLCFVVTLGNLWGTGMSRAFVGSSAKSGWLIPTAMQLIPPALILFSVPFTPESPRWLISKGKNEAALRSLNRVRTKNDVINGLTGYEVAALEEAIEQARITGNGSWLDLFRGNHFRRTMVAAWTYIFQQITGQQFVNSYGPTFYAEFGFGTEVFTFQVVVFGLISAGALVDIFIIDAVGRRTLLLVGSFLSFVFMLLVAGLGTKSDINATEANAVIAFIMLFYVAEKMSLSVNAPVIASEIGGVRLRKKTLAFAATCDVLAAFTVTYSVPYLLGKPGANLGPKVAWIFAAIAGAAFLFVLFFVPETANRSLEEMDELFEMNLWAWQFKGAQTTGVGRRIAQIEGGDAAGGEGKFAGELTEGERANGEKIRAHA